MCTNKWEYASRWGSIILRTIFWNSLHVGSTYGAYVGSSPGFGRESCCHVIVARSFTLQEKPLIWWIVSGIKILSEAQQHSLDNAGICLDTVTLCSLNRGQKCAGHSRQWTPPLYSVIGCSTSVRIDDSSRFFVYRAGADIIKPGLPGWTLLFKHLYSNASLFVHPPQGYLPENECGRLNLACLVLILLTSSLKIIYEL